MRAACCVNKKGSIGNLLRWHAAQRCGAHAADNFDCAGVCAAQPDLAQGDAPCGVDALHHLRRAAALDCLEVQAPGEQPGARRAACFVSEGSWVCHWGLCASSWWLEPVHHVCQHVLCNLKGISWQLSGHSPAARARRYFCWLLNGLRRVKAYTCARRHLGLM